MQECVVGHKCANQRHLESEDGDPATRGWETVFQERVPGANGQAHTTIKGAGHFVQEQKGEELALLVAEFAAAG